MGAKGNKGRPFSIRMSSEMRDVIDRIATKERRSLSDEIAHLIDLGLEEYERRMRIIEKEKGDAGPAEERNDPILSSSAV